MAQWPDEVQLGTPAGSRPCWVVGRGDEAEVGVGPSPCGRACWGMCLLGCGASTQGSGDGMGVAGGGIAMTTCTPLHNPSWGSVMGFVWLSLSC